MIIHLTQIDGKGIRSVVVCYSRISQLVETTMHKRFYAPMTFKNQQQCGHKKPGIEYSDHIVKFVIFFNLIFFFLFRAESQDMYAFPNNVNLNKRLTSSLWKALHERPR